MIYDITRTITPTLHVWEGDTSYQTQALVRIEDGNSVNLMTLHMSAHTGTHADAYFHYEVAGNHPATMPLNAYIGRARVVSIEKRHGVLTPADFAHVNLEHGERLLIHSWISELDDSEWPQDIPVISVALLDYLASLGYQLIGTDAPSVDPYDSKTLDAHHALYRHGMVNLEHITLRNVPDGDYELVALPLKLDLACASPVRAILRTL